MITAFNGCICDHGFEWMYVITALNRSVCDHGLECMYTRSLPRLDVYVITVFNGCVRDHGMVECM